MPIKLSLRKTIGGFIPANEISETAMADLPMGKDIKALCTVERSRPQNNWFHLVLHELFKNQDTWPTEKLFKRKIKEALGLGDWHEVKGKMYFEPASVAFHKMEQPEFNQFIDRFEKLVCERIIPHFSPKDTRAMFQLLDANTGVIVDNGIEYERKQSLTKQPY